MSGGIRIGVLGFAHGHVTTYCKEWLNEPELGVIVAAGWDHDAGRLEAARASLGLEPCVSAAELLARGDISAVVIGAETSLHAELVEQAAASGKTIVLQKPLALTLGEAERIVAAVNRHGVRFTMSWQMRVDPQNAQMKAMLASGEFGQVFMVRRRHGLPMGLNADFADSWHVNPGYNRDIWADDASHPFDLFLWLFGLPESVTAEIASLYNPRIPNDNGIAIFRYPGGGPLAEVNGSFTCTAAENTMEIVCEKGTIVQNYGDAVSCNVPRPEGGGAGLKWYKPADGKWTASEIASPPSHSRRIQGLAQPLAAFLRGEREPIATAEEGLAALRMVLASYVSSREGRRVRLDDPAIARV